MSDGDTVEGGLDNGDHRSRFSNPDRPVGAALWALSRSSYASKLSFLAGALWVLTLGWIAVEIAAEWPEAAVFLGASGFAGLMIALQVDEMADDVLCSRCGYRHSGRHAYCPSCGEARPPAEIEG